MELVLQLESITLNCTVCIYRTPCQTLHKSKYRSKYALTLQNTILAVHAGRYCISCASLNISNHLYPDIGVSL